MRELHVIIHEDAVRAYADMGSSTAKSVLGEISQIKTTQNYLEIPSHWKPYELHPDMPLPADDLQVFVSGGYKGTCCTMQLFKLKESGYNAKFHPTANCPGQGILPSMILRDIEEKYPDFYD